MNSDYVIETLASMEAFRRESAEDNANDIRRLKRNLKIVIEDELTTRQKKVLVMYYFERKTITQIAKELGVHISTASRTLSRARNRIEKCLKYSL